MSDPAFLAPEQVRVRFAPSPTGLLHIGGVRTVLFNWLLANGQAPRDGKSGAFLLRIEDTDRNRLVEGAEAGILDVLSWFGVDWDEGPDVGGPHAPYRQSERTARYQAHAQHLLDTGHAYRCFCTPERLQQVREEQAARKEPPGYDRFCRDLSEEQIAANLAEGKPFVIRFRAPLEGETVVHDLLRVLGLAVQELRGGGVRALLPARIHARQVIGVVVALAGADVSALQHALHAPAPAQHRCDAQVDVQRTRQQGHAGIGTRLDRGHAVPQPGLVVGRRDLWVQPYHLPRRRWGGWCGG